MRSRNSFFTTLLAPTAWRKLRKDRYMGPGRSLSRPRTISGFSETWWLLAREVSQEMGPVFINIGLPPLEELSDQASKIVTVAKYRYILPA